MSGESLRAMAARQVSGLTEVTGAGAAPVACQPSSNGCRLASVKRCSTLVAAPRPRKAAGAAAGDPEPAKAERCSVPAMDLLYKNTVAWASSGRFLFYSFFAGR